MKERMLKRGALALIMLLFAANVLAQGKSRSVITQTRDLAPFDAIKVSAVFKVVFTQGEPQSVKVETAEELMDNVSTTVNGTTLDISIRGSIRNPGRMMVYITAKDLKSLNLSGASKFNTTNKIVTPQLSLDLSGVAYAGLTAEVSKLSCNLSGVSKLEIQGTGDQLNADISGTSKILASQFEVNEAKVNASGVSNAYINASKSVSADASGVSNIKYVSHENMEVKKNSSSRTSNITRIGGNDGTESSALMEVNSQGDSTKVRLGNLDISVKEGDQTEVRIGRNKLIVDEDGKVQFFKNKRKNSFHGHWAGFYIGINGFLTPDGKLDPPVPYDNMSLRLGKSTNVQLNLFEQNFKITENAGLVTGLGIEWRNYRFDKNNLVLKDNTSTFETVLMTDASYKKSKLLVTYLNIPLLLELQTNRFTNHSSFHIAGGINSGLRIGSHSKVKFENNDGGTQKSKTRDDFFLNPLKFDAMVLVGWGNVNLYSTYALTDMFKSGKGPELRPFSIGLRLVFD
ncbi:MAG: DUF2807 domain-containing protein [Bacteroidetes bacterium]|nr:DUF2807 domain-containing protein [Bacteroidota bacterium]